jgi:uncharacterized membrane protein
MRSQPLRLFTPLATALLCSAGTLATAADLVAEFIAIPGATTIPGRNQDYCGLSGSPGYSGVRVSADGTTVVTVAYIPGTFDGYVPRVAARWTRAEGTEIIPPGIPEDFYSAVGISSDGNTIYGPTWRWNASDGYSNLFPPFQFGRLIFGSSDDGSVVAGISGNYPLEGDAFIWNVATGTPTNLPRAAGVPTGYYYFKTISGDGRVVGASARAFDPEDFTGADRYAGAIITGENVELITDLGPQNILNDLNFDGSVAVGQFTDSGGSLRAFRWDRQGGLVLLDEGFSRASSSSARAISADGSTVVGEYLRFGFPGTDAFIWTQATGFEDLRSYLSTNFDLREQIDNWRLLSAIDVSGDGRTIVGQGINPDGCQQAFAVIISSPACTADFNVDGGVDGSDIESFFIDWAQSLPSADINIDGGIDGGDVESFYQIWSAGC